MNIRLQSRHFELSTWTLNWLLDGVCIPYVKSNFLLAVWTACKCCFNVTGNILSYLNSCLVRKLPDMDKIVMCMVRFPRFHRIVLNCLPQDWVRPIFVDLASYDMSSGQSWHPCDHVILPCHPHDTASNTLLCSTPPGCQSSDRRATTFATNIARSVCFIMKIVFVGP